MQKPQPRSALIVLLLQIGMFAAVPMAHAEAEAAAYTTAVHISYDVDHGCLAHVDHLCQLCRSSMRILTARKPVTQLKNIERRLASPLAPTNSVTWFPGFSSLGPRAPPR